MSVPMETDQRVAAIHLRAECGSPPADRKRRYDRADIEKRGGIAASRNRFRFSIPITRAASETSAMNGNIRRASVWSVPFSGSGKIREPAHP